MVAFAPNTDKVVTTATGNIKDAAPVNARVFLASLMATMGVLAVVPGNTAPIDKDALWYYLGGKEWRRWNEALGNWYALTPNELARHLIRRAIIGSPTDGTTEVNDLFVFWDTSAKDVKIITRDNLSVALMNLRTLTTQEGIQGGGLLGSNRTIKLNVNGLTNKPMPAGDDYIPIYSTVNSAHRKASVASIRSDSSGDAFFYGE